MNVKFEHEVRILQKSSYLKNMLKRIFATSAREIESFGRNFVWVAEIYPSFLAVDIYEAHQSVDLISL